jgi:hypothetical protein
MRDMQSLWALKDKYRRKGIGHEARNGMSDDCGVHAVRLIPQISQDVIISGAFFSVYISASSACILPLHGEVCHVIMYPIFVPSSP